MNESTVTNPVLLFFRRYSDRVKDLVITPRVFFQNMRGSEDFWDPTLFALVNLLVPEVLLGIILMPLTFGVSILWIIPSVLYGMLFLALVAIILYGIARCLGNDFSLLTAYQVMAYASLTNYLGLIPIPILNSFLVSIALSVLVYVAMEETYGFPRPRAIGISIVPGVLSITIGLISTLVKLAFLLIGFVRLFMWLFFPVSDPAVSQVLQGSGLFA